MANVINATSTGNGGLVSTGDDSGILNIQTNETTAITVDASQNTTFAGNTTVSKAQAIQSVTSTTGTNSVYTQYTNTGGSAYVGINNSTGADFGNAAYALQVYHAGAYPIVFSTNNSERMRIDSSGNSWFRTTGSIETWNATTGTYAKIGDATYPIGTTAPGLNMILNRNTSTGQILEFKYNATAVGTVSVTGSATAYNTSSDYRLKENIAPIIGALTKVAQLKPVTYKWKVDGSDGEGFIAHELAEVFPQAVDGTKDAVDENGKPIHQGIDTSFLVATLTAAIQELKAINDTQTETINALTARIVALEGQ